MQSVEAGARHPLPYYKGRGELKEEKMMNQGDSLLSNQKGEGMLRDRFDKVFISEKIVFYEISKIFKGLDIAGLYSSRHYHLFHLCRDSRVGTSVQLVSADE